MPVKRSACCNDKHQTDLFEGIVEAGLSFIGLGDPNKVSWGYLLRNAQEFLRSAWWMAFFPGVCIFLLVTALNLVGDGLNDVLNPRLRER